MTLWYFYDFLSTLHYIWLKIYVLWECLFVFMTDYYVYVFVIKYSKTLQENKNMISKITEIEVVNQLKPPVDNLSICEYIMNLPEEQQLKCCFYIIGELSARYNNITKNSVETAQVLQIDGLANFLRDNRRYIEDFEINRKTNKVQYKGVDINKDMYDLQLSPIDVLSHRLSETFNHRYTFSYSFVLTAVKKALRLNKGMDKFERIENIDSIVKTINKRRITIKEVQKYLTEGGITKREIKEILIQLGWTENKYSSGNVYFTKR